MSIPEFSGDKLLMHQDKLMQFKNNENFNPISMEFSITNRCNADCVFCDRKGEAVLDGYNLKMPKSEEPDAKVYIDKIGDPTKYKEIVFCGSGATTISWEDVKKIKKKGN